MREKGVDMPDPQVLEDGDGGMGFSIGGPGGAKPASKDAFEKADAACRHFLAGIVQNKRGPQMSAEDQDKMLEFASCMREHGVDMPDPDFSSGGATIKIGGPGDGSGDGSGDGDQGARSDPNNETFKAAEEACHGLLPGGGPKNNSSGPGTDTIPVGKVNQ
jgi:hypothetical protein